MYVWIFIFLTAFVHQLIGMETYSGAKQPEEANQTECDRYFLMKRPILEIKGGYFIFADAKMRKIYDQGGLDVQASLSYPILKEWLQIYGSVEWLGRNGKASGSKTNFWALPISLGLKPVLTIASFAQAYFAIGPRYAYAHQHNFSPFVDKNVSKNCFGGFINTGFNFFPISRLLVDIFGEYSYVRSHFNASKPYVYGETVQVGGFVVGAGLGYRF